MYKFCSLLLCSLLCSVHVFGQVKKTDEIKKLEREAVRLLKSPSLDDIEEGYVLAKELLSYAKKSGDAQSEIDAYTLYARYFDRTGDYRNSIKNSLLIVEHIDDIPNVDYHRSLTDFIVLLDKFDFDQEALNYERRLLSLYSNDREQSRVSVYKLMPKTFAKLEMPDSAVYYRHKSLEFALKSKDPYLVLGGYNSLGVTHRDIGNMDIASFNFAKADSVFQLPLLWNKRDSSLHATVCGNWGDLLMKQGQFEKGEALLEYDIKYNLTSGELGSSLNAVVALAMNYVEHGSFSKGILVLERGLDAIAASKRSFKSTKLKMYRLLTKCYQGINNGEKASHYFLKFESLSAIIDSESKKGQRVMEYEFISANVGNQLKIERLENKQKEDELVHMKEEEQHNQLIMWIVVGIVLGGSLITFYFISKHRRIEKGLADKTLENKDLELKYKQDMLTKLALETSRKQEFSKALVAKIKQLESPHAGLSSSLIQYIQTELNMTDSTTNLNAELRELNDSFFVSLSTVYPNLTEKERDLCVMIKLNLSNKEIAVLKGISAESVKVTKNRLKKKMNLDPELTVNQAMQKI